MSGTVVVHTRGMRRSRSLEEMVGGKTGMVVLETTDMAMAAREVVVLGVAAKVARVEGEVRA
jgi:hypothetical protein